MVFARIARNSGNEKTASCRSEHVREVDMSLGIPGCSANQEIFTLVELIDEPDHHEAIAPVSHERGTSDGFLAALTAGGRDVSTTKSFGTFLAPLESLMRTPESRRRPMCVDFSGESQPIVWTKCLSVPAGTGTNQLF